MDENAAPQDSEKILNWFVCLQHLIIWTWATEPTKLAELSVLFPEKDWDVAFDIACELKNHGTPDFGKEPHGLRWLALHPEHGYLSSFHRTGITSYDLSHTGDREDACRFGACHALFYHALGYTIEEYDPGQGQLVQRILTEILIQTEVTETSAAFKGGLTELTEAIRRGVQ